MWSSEGKPADTGANRQQLLNTTPINWEQESEREQIFELIDSLLSFEACLYHQILPLRLQNNRLSLGMVNPEDSGALDYVNRIMSYIKGTIETQEITTEIHCTILSAYLSYKNTSHLEVKPAEQPATEINLAKSINTASYLHHSTTPSSEVQQSHKYSEPQIDVSPLSHSQNYSQTAKNLSEVSTTQEVPTVLLSDVTVLQMQAPELFSPIEALVNLPSRKLLEELLGRVLGGGIGRLYLERQPYQGRIIWSDNGVLQSVLENLPLSVFQGVLNELKRFAALPLSTLAEPQQIEKECQYQNSRLLLRIRVMPGINGEEATLQVLRGAALKFYQQQQLDRLSRDVIGISQQLSYKLHELQQRLLLNPHLKSEQSEALSMLTRLVENLDQQVKILTANNQ
ncbi:GspE/PulE/PilB domain-containing protein [Anabaena subtropica]|uniref:Pilus assembly protein PilB n=1 Tax=Anabaena subtropica FACHB-260 TaxID=2692884 RepID=A0ABR8CJ07_9NOST|nr:pilus assembly protein PilB [Anabaena subtropica]MBD2343014.1 pilus assembly protein PilB [Anabaena subtropica FACHB-260]